MASSKKPKSKAGSAGSSAPDAEAPSADAPALERPPRVSRHVQPLGPRVLVRIEERPDRLDSGLYLPASAKDGQSDALLGAVLEVARTQAKTEVLDDDDDDRDEDDRMGLGDNVSGIPLGAKVLIPHDRGITVPWDATLRLVEVRHVLAIVEEIPEEKLQ